MKRECVAAEVSVVIEPRMQLEEISTSVARLKFDRISAAGGTFETCPPILRMSVYRSRPEVPWSDQADANDPQQTLLRDAREYYRSGFDFHSTASFCASAICAGVICCATRFRLLITSWSLRTAAKLSHMYA